MSVSSTVPPPAVTPTKRPCMSPIPRSATNGDRYIPLRDENRWTNKFAITKHVRRTGELGKFHRRLQYSCLLKNELLNANIESIKGQGYKARGVVPLEDLKLFQYASPNRNGHGFAGDATSLAASSLSPISAKSQKLLRSLRKATQKISPVPFKVLHAPELQDDICLNLVDWGLQNVLSVGLGRSVYLLSAHTGHLTKLCEFSEDIDSVTSVAWNGPGNLVAVGTFRGSVQVWNTDVNQQIYEIQGHAARVGALSWNGNVLSSGSFDTCILHHDIRAPNRVTVTRFVGHQLEVCNLKWCPDYHFLASSGSDGRVCVWHLNSSSKPVQTYTNPYGTVKAMGWSPHHRGLLACGGDSLEGAVYFFDTLSMKHKKYIHTGGEVCSLAWSKHSSELVSTHGYPRNEICVWKYPSLTRVADLTGHSCRVLYLALSPDGEAIVTGAGDETLCFWKVFRKASVQMENKSVLGLFASIR